ncbi:hypothetical protein GGQ88_001240 [Novosphingobium hassiacum]|uniref:DUF1289 domain-containing protein n=1 Tax=Novosphingobium hassiacum TaxID=173676 RepID=A0A7W5ZWW2_9SPHN|nr:DUF1289 domain-containing protein [Novosphingobium hassiacum]MBB3859979.1 hypothetical protein [Novosphingobium hassiacum]
MTEPEIASPCTGVCTIDAARRLCIGCARTLDEIAAWPEASIEQKQTIIAQITHRRLQA